MTYGNRNPQPKSRAEPDYEAAAEALWSVTGKVDGQWPTKWGVGTKHIREQARFIVDAAIGDRLLVRRKE